MWAGGDFTRIRDIMSVTKPCGLNYNVVDAYILFINREDFRSYSFTHFFEIGYKRGQPIHPVIVQAPVEYDCDLDITDGNYTEKHKDFHNKVSTHGIAHELGHALARLQDEYANPNNANRKYESKFRNVDYDTNYKW